MAQGVVDDFDAEHGFGLIRSDVSGEILRFTTQDLVDRALRKLEPGAHVRYDVVMGLDGKEAVRVSPI